MNESQRLDRVQADLRLAGQILYCEGKTDPAAVYALLGKPVPRDGVVGDCLVVGLGSGGSGGAEVSELVRVARKNGIDSVWGIRDGDGEPLTELLQRFDTTATGPVFNWQGYCIENLLARAAWPEGWGAQPDWQIELQQYAPYAALNRLHVRLRNVLSTLQLHRFRSPDSSGSLLVAADIETALQSDAHLLSGRQVDVEFKHEYQQVMTLLATSAEEAHCVINGKWLIKDFAVRRTGKSPDQCRTEWLNAVTGAGGLPEVIAWWTRTTGAAP